MFSSNAIRSSSCLLWKSGLSLSPNAIEELVAAHEQLVSADRGRAVEFRIVTFKCVMADKFIFRSHPDYKRAGSSADGKHVITSRYHRRKELDSPATSDTCYSGSENPLTRLCPYTVCDPLLINPIQVLVFKYWRGNIRGITRAPQDMSCLLYTSPSPRDLSTSRMPSSA